MRIAPSKAGFLLLLRVVVVLSVFLAFAAAGAFAYSGADAYLEYPSQYLGNIALDAANQRLFVAFQDQDRVDVLSTVDYHVIRSIVIASPSSIDLSPDGTTLAVATNSAHIVFFNTTTFGKTNDVEFSQSAAGISGFFYTANGNAIVRAEQGISTGGGITAYWDHLANAFLNVSNAEMFTGPYLTDGQLIARSGDYSRVILADNTTAGAVQIIDGNTGNVLWNYGFGNFINGLAINRSANRYAICVSGQLVLLDGSFNAVYQDQAGCSGMTFSADGSVLYRDVAGTSSSSSTQAFDVTALKPIRQTTNLYDSASSFSSTFWKAADSAGMVYGTFSVYPGGAVLVAVDTTQSSTPSAPSTNPLKIVRVIDNIGSPKGGDPVRIVCSGVANATTSSIAVTIGGQSATVLNVGAPDNWLFMDTRMILVSTPAGSPGMADVVVTTNSGSYRATQAFQYASAAKTISVTGSPSFLLFDQGRNKLYAANGGQVEVLDPATMQLSTPLVPASGKLSNSQFEGLSLSPGGARLYVADAGAKLIHILNLNSLGMGTSVDPGTLLGKPGGVTPVRVFELASGRVMGEDAGSNLTSSSSFQIFLLDVTAATGSYLKDVNGNTLGGELWDRTTDGAFLLASANINGVSSGGQALWDDANSHFIGSQSWMVYGEESAMNGDGSVIAVGGSTPGLMITAPSILTPDLSSTGEIYQQFQVWPPVGAPSLSFHPSGALLYKAGYFQSQVESVVGKQVGGVVIYDLQQAQAIATVVLPESPVTSYAPASSHTFATDPSGQHLFVVTQTGISVVTLNVVPLSVGSLTPNFGTPAGGETVTIRGSGFQQGTTATVGGLAAASTFLDADTLSIIVPAFAAGWQDLTVTNPGGASYTFHNAFNVIAGQPVPVISGFSPAAVPVQSGIAGFDTSTNVTVLGSGFVNDDRVEINGNSVNSAFIDPGHIQVTIPATLTGATGSLAFTVVSPYTGSSNSMMLPMVNPVPVAQSFTPDSLVTGSTNASIAVYGTGFVNSSVVQLNGQNLSTTLVQGMTAGSNLEVLTAVVPASLVANSGTGMLTVFNPAPAGGTSGALTVPIAPVHPEVSFPIGIDFGKVTVNMASLPVQINVVNTGTANYVMNSATVAGPAAFSLVSSYCTQSVPPQYACAMSLRFAPTTVGTMTGTLVITDNAPGSPHSISLSGISLAVLTLNVPADSATIQGAINQTISGDTVVVAPGTYNENIDFKGKNITLISSAGPAQTIVDGGKKGAVVSFANSETRGAVLNGFTIQNGSGAGVSVANANPTVTGNIINNNTGYGVLLSFAGALIQGNTISNTTTNITGTNYGCDWSDGTGIAAGGTSNYGYGLEISNNTIQGNAGQCEGAGIQLYAAPLTTIASNIIRNNQAQGEGGAISMYNGNQVMILQNLIVGNQAGGAGGGIYLGLTSEQDRANGPINTIITNNTIANNTIVQSTLIQDAWVDGSQIAFGGYAAQSAMFNNIILAGSESYAAISCYSTYQYLSGSAPVVAYSDVLNTAGAAYGGWCTSPSGGTGNLAVAPKFVNAASGDYHLASGSAGIDAGFNAAPGTQSSDLDGNARIQNGSNAALAVVDMGAYEFAGTPNGRGSSQTTLSPGASTVQYGQPLQITVNVSAGSATATGTVTLLDDWSPVAQATLDATGTATFSVSTLAVGSRWLVAVYNGNSAYVESASAAVGVGVTGFATSTNLIFSPSPVLEGQPEVLTAMVTSASGTPTGNVQFILNNPVSKTVSVPLDANGVASYTTATLSKGADYIQAVYPGQGGFLASYSSNQPLQVNAVSTTVTLTASPTTIVYGQSVTLTATLQSSVGTPTGTISFTDGVSLFGSAQIVSGVATYATTNLTSGTRTITASYPGDSTHSAATSAPTQVIVQDFTVATATSGAGTVVAGQTFTSSLVVTPASGFTGTVTLSCAVPVTMSESSCSASSVQVTGTSSQNSTLTVTTRAARHAALRHSGIPLFYAVGLLFSGIFFIATGSDRRLGLVTGRMLLLGLVLIAVGLGSCGGGGSSTGSGSSDPGTPAGSYTITITAVSGTASHSVTQVVTVQ